MVFLRADFSVWKLSQTKFESNENPKQFYLQLLKEKIIKLRNNYPEEFCKYVLLEKFRNKIHKETSVLESFFNYIAGSGFYLMYK